tara:strand:- start:2240 stop:2509 length:270 start_codon:yes stop_codon:yes gene_type:complete
MLNDTYIHNCRICGFSLEEPPWGYDGKTPLYEFCPCCGVEFGYQDSSLEGVKRFREQWIENGMQWDEVKQKPDNWNPLEQFKNIPPEFR